MRVSRYPDQYPTTALRPALTRYAAWLASTSGVEQMFNLADWSCGKTAHMLDAS